MQKLRVRYAKRGKMRFTSTRDFQRALERAVRRAGVPMAYSAGFHPHPRISYANAAPTGTASEAEYVELSVTRRIDPQWLAGALDVALPEGLDVVQVAEAAPGALADRLQVSRWRLEFADTTAAQLTQAVAALLAAGRVEVTRLMKQGPRELDVREPLLAAEVAAPEAVTSDGPAPGVPALALEVTVRHTTPTIRPEEIWRALSQVGPGALPRPRSTRLAQGVLAPDGSIGDPLAG